MPADPAPPSEATVLLVGRAMDRGATVPRVLRSCSGEAILVATPAAGATPLAGRLRQSLSRAPDAAMAVAVRHGLAPGPLSLGDLLRRPADLAPVAVRGGALAGLDLPPLGPPDVVGGRAWAWLLAVAVASRGRRVLGVEAPPRPTPPPTHPDRLTPAGRAWLVECALALVPPGALDAELCRELIAAALDRPGAGP